MIANGVQIMTNHDVALESKVMSNIHKTCLRLITGIPFYFIFIKGLQIQLIAYGV